MSFLAPLFLAALATLVVPILLHRRRHRPKNRVPFPAVQFLDPGTPVQRRRRIEHWLLLALRCLAVAFLVAAFARPFLGRDSAPVAAETATYRLILVDLSASMQGAAFDRARASARAAIATAGRDDVIAVAGFDRALRVSLSPEQSRQLAPAERRRAAEAALTALRPGWDRTNLAQALTLAADLLDQARESPATPAVITLVSDLQRTAGTGELAGFDWPGAMQVQVRPVPPPDGWTNASVHAADRPGSARVANAPASENGAFTLQVGDGPVNRIELVPGATRTVPAPDARVVRLAGDDFTFDNEAWLAPSRPPRVTVDYRGGARPDDPRDTLFFLRRAMVSTPAYEIALRENPPPNSPAAFTVYDGAEPGAAALGDGDTALLLLRDASSAAALEALTGRSVPLAETRPAAPALLATLRFDDPVLQPFADQKFSNFQRLSFWAYRRLDPAALPGAQVLASFDSGDPALLRVPVGAGGQGTLFVLTTTWRPDDSQLALSSKFVPLLHSLLAQAPAVTSPARQVPVGESVVLPRGATAVVRPDGEVLPAKDGSFGGADRPGLYTTRGAEFTFAANVSAAESDLTPLGDAEIAALALPLQPPAPSSQPPAARRALVHEELERQQRWWWWLAAAAVGFVIAETLLATWTSRSRFPVAA